MIKKGKKNKNSNIEGTIRLTTHGVGFITDDSGENIEIENKYLNTAFNGDVVCVSVKEEGGKKIGEVTKIVARKKEHHVCTIKKSGELFFCIPQDTKMYVDILIPKRFLEKANPGEKVVTKIVSWDSGNRNPIGKVTRVLGEPLSHNTEMEAILYDKDLVIDFEPDVLKEAKEVRKYLYDKKSIEKRRNMSDTTTFTIDPEDAKDFDDALSIKILPSGDYEIGIHIADVTYFVRPGTKLDKEASRRATSVYLVDRTIPMLPPDISNDLCSLNPNEDKLAFSAIFVMDTNGNIKEEWFGRTIIYSNKRFSYEDAQNVLNKKEEKFHKELKILNDIAHKLGNKIKKAGAIGFHNTEVRFVLDENKRPVSIVEKKQFDTHKLVENFMLIANKRVTEYVEKLAKKSGIKKDFIYRVHDIPDPEKIKNLLHLLKSLGYDIHINSPIESEDINKILNTVRGKSEELLIQKAAIKSMTKAIYTTKNIGHFGLAFPFYTHFTSPIRRYPDIMVHRLLDIHLHNKKISEKDWGIYVRLAEHSSRMERVAEEAERESIKFKQAEFMREHIGEIYNGIISGVTPWGIYVEEETSRSEGLVGLKTLTDDYYEYNEKDYALIGQRSKKKLQLGNKVKIKVKNVNLSKKQIDYILV